MRGYFAPLTNRELRRQARLDARFATRSQARLIGREARAGEQNVAGIAEALAAAEQGLQPRVADIYGRARTSLGALDAAQLQALGQTGPGSSIASDLQRRLALAGTDTGQTAALQEATRGAGGAGFSR